MRIYSYYTMTTEIIAVTGTVENLTLTTEEPSISDFPLDPNVIAAFPPGTKILSSGAFGTSAWAGTARVQVLFPDGEKSRYFLKTTGGDDGKALIQGEFSIMSEIHKWAPDFVPKPYAWGKYADPTSQVHFFLSEYIDMKQRMPNPNDLCQRLARLHRESQSPTGQFGFHTTTCQGRIPQKVDWESNWTVFFTNLLQHVITLDFQYNEAWDALDTVEKRFIAKVIPRLLDALVQDGRKIKPCLIHGDLWEGNSGFAFDSKKTYIFDAGGYYAHNEMEVANWRCYYNKISNKSYTRTYLKYFRPSEPKAEWEDRNRLYSIYYNVIYSVNHGTQGKAVRQL